MSNDIISVNGRLIIRKGNFEETFIRAGGPGGQNVNKVSTGVQLRLYTKQLDLPADVTTRLIMLAGQRATKEGDILIEASRFRSQERNREDARQRLIHLINRAIKLPPPPRKKSRPTRSAIECRLKQKSNRSMIKKLRSSVSGD